LLVDVSNSMPINVIIERNIEDYNEMFIRECAILEHSKIIKIFRY